VIQNRRDVLEPRNYSDAAEVFGVSVIRFEGSNLITKNTSTSRSKIRAIPYVTLDAETFAQ